jgi:hypothetical protein
MEKREIQPHPSRIQARNEGLSPQQTALELSRLEREMHEITLREKARHPQILMDHVPSYLTHREWKSAFENLMEYGNNVRGREQSDAFHDAAVCAALTTTLPENQPRKREEIIPLAPDLPEYHRYMNSQPDSLRIRLNQAGEKHAVFFDSLIADSTLLAGEKEKLLKRHGVTG